MNMVFKTGSTEDPQGFSGLSDVTSGLLDKGTKTRGAVEIANQIQAIGARFSTASSSDAANVRMLTLKENLDQAMDIYADVIQNADFPDAELETYRKRLLVSLLQRRDDPGAISNLVYNKILYGDSHPYGVTLTEKSTKAITRDKIKNFYETFYRPNNATLVVVGDTSMGDLKKRLENKIQRLEGSRIFYCKTV